MNTPAPLAARYVQACGTVAVTLHQPGRTRRSPHHVIIGRLLGEMQARSTVHHYRVEGSDGVLYLAPPAWLAPACRIEVSNACITARLRDPSFAIVTAMVAKLKRSGLISPLPGEVA